MIQQSQVSVLANVRVDQRGGHDTGGQFREGWSPLAALTAFRPFSVHRITSAAIGIMTACSPGPPLLSRAPNNSRAVPISGCTRASNFSSGSELPLQFAWPRFVDAAFHLRRQSISSHTPIKPLPFRDISYIRRQSNTYRISLLL